MKPVRWTSHALERVGERLIDTGLAEQVLADPELVLQGRHERTLHVRRYLDSVLSREMLLILVVEQHPNETVVVSAYKTSRTARFLRRSQP